jgi:hypothetical protein
VLEWRFEFTRSSQTLPVRFVSFSLHLFPVTIKVALAPGGIPVHIRSKEVRVANTKNIKDKAERKKLKRAARKKAAPKAERTFARGSHKRKVKKMARGQTKR